MLEFNTIQKFSNVRPKREPSNTRILEINAINHKKITLLYVDLESTPTN